MSQGVLTLKPVILGLELVAIMMCKCCMFIGLHLLISTQLDFMLTDHIASNIFY
jgi:hypothetical protein